MIGPRELISACATSIAEASASSRVEKLPVLFLLTLLDRVGRISRLDPSCMMARFGHTLYSKRQHMPSSFSQKVKLRPLSRPELLKQRNVYILSR